MGTAKKKGLKVKSLDSIRVVAGTAGVNGKNLVNIIRVSRLNVEASRTVAHLAAGIFQIWCFSLRYKAPGFSIPRCVTLKALLIFGRGEFFFHYLEAFKRNRLFGKTS